MDSSEHGADDTQSQHTVEAPTAVQHEVVVVYKGRPVYTCATCTAVLALQDEVISKSFSGREGRGYLLHSAVNVSLGKREDRPLLTGVHTVCDTFCNGCEERVGWYYVSAKNDDQKYKEGKYLLEKERLVKENGW